VSGTVEEKVFASAETAVLGACLAILGK